LLGHNVFAVLRRHVGLLRLCLAAAVFVVLILVLVVFILFVLVAVLPTV
jgi:hypothetical protein